MRRRTTALLAIVVLATSCSMIPGGGAADGAGGPGGAAVVPADPDAEVRPDLLVVDPPTAAPGDVVALTFPEETTRGILFVLDQSGDDTWITRFFLTSDGPGAGWERTWSPADAGLVAVEDIGVGGPGPDHVLVPEVAEPGAYRICTGNAGENFCAPIEIVAP